MVPSDPTCPRTHEKGRQAVLRTHGLPPRFAELDPMRYHGGNGTTREDGMPQRILVVDDDENIVRLLKLDLLDAGYDVTVAMDGSDAGTRFQE